MRACGSTQDPRCADEQTQARALLAQMHAADWRSTRFMTAAGLLLAAQGQAEQALQYLQVAARQGHLHAGHFRDDAPMQPILNNDAVLHWLNALPPAPAPNPAQHASNGCACTGRLRAT